MENGRGAQARPDVVTRAKAILASRDPKHVAACKAANEALLRCKLVGPSTVHRDTTLSNVSIQYRNEEFIGTRLMPIVRVKEKSADYWTYSKRDRLAGPDDALGARARANEVAENRSTATYAAKNYGLQGYVDAETLMIEDAPLNELVDVTASVNDVMDLREEERIATIMTTAANYSGNTLALSGTDRLDSTSGGNPIKLIQDAQASLWSGAGPSKTVMFMGLEVWHYMSRNPALLELFKYNSSGLLSKQDLMRFFMVDEVLIGAARHDTANEGQTASYSRIWGKQLGIVKVATAPGIRNASFGYTFRWQDKITTQWFDPSVGIAGGYYTKVAVSEDHKVVAPDTGFLYTTVIS